uniref:4-nitrophenylphosphatase n=1 Tax=Dendroctonus ponderosae TaxID=77166 RepID=A0AAR5PNP8_DENPD
MAAKRLLDLPKDEQLNFFNSFDTVLCDVDGVLWLLIGQIIERSPDGILALRKLGKKFYFITNNSLTPMDLYLQKMKDFEIAKEEVIRPVVALTWYLKQLNFDQEIYVAGSTTIKKELSDAGFKVAYDEVSPVCEGNVPNLLKLLSDLRPNVKAVYIDFRFNIDFMILQKCIAYIMKNQALFIVGMLDPVVLFSEFHLIGAKKFAKIIEEITGVEPKLMSKGGKEFAQVLKDNLGPFDAKRTLFIGDSCVTDMPFATENGFQKLMPLTGLTREEDLKNWKFDERIKPDYVVDNVGDLSTIIANLDLNKL